MLRPAELGKPILITGRLDAGVFVECGPAGTEAEHITTRPEPPAGNSSGLLKKRAHRVFKTLIWHSRLCHGDGNRERKRQTGCNTSHAFPLSMVERAGSV